MHARDTLDRVVVYAHTHADTKLWRETYSAYSSIGRKYFITINVKGKRVTHTNRHTYNH